MAARHLALLVALAASSVTLAFVTGCEEFRCCNSCGRDFFLEDEQATVRAWLVDLGQGGNECEIERTAPSLEDGSYALRLEVVAGGQNAWAEVLEFGPAEDQSVCMGLAMEGAEALLDASPGEVLCVSGSVHSETTCTQLACAGT